MSQQYQQPTGSGGQQTYGGGTTQQQPGAVGQGGGQQAQQSGGTHRMTHERVGRQFESEMTPELNEALESFDRVVEIAEWCADKCIESGPQMAECARLCQDLADLASLNEKLIARDSINGPEIAEAYLKVAQQGLPILQQFQQSPHVSETLQAVTQSVDATNKLLSSIGRGQQVGQQMGQGMGQQSVGRQQSFQQPQQGGQQAQQPGGQQPMGHQTQQGGQSFQGQTGQQSQQPTGQQFQGAQSY